VELVAEGHGGKKGALETLAGEAGESHQSRRLNTPNKHDLLHNDIVAVLNSNPFGRNSDPLLLLFPVATKVDA
jgi:hypothetical protein